MIDFLSFFCSDDPKNEILKKKKINMPSFAVIHKKGFLVFNIKLIWII